MSKRTDGTWRDSQTAKNYLDEIAGAIPLEAEQLDIMMRIIRQQRDTVKNFLDIGCGDGILSSVVLREYPQAQGTLLDFSDTMLSAAKEKLGSYPRQLQFVKSDYGDEQLDETLTAGRKQKFDVIVSRFSIHHQTNERKYQVYEEIYNLLVPDGIFINIEHVAPRGPWGKALF
ncbi:MAG: class I SAM-dependent methyltransferase [Candidatus Theseobacter exili]|nr:class I SAM-dependent methyltransferase [Candidatus Theseobacter exili]